jgi:plasmid stabilization system protein ParE
LAEEVEKFEVIWTKNAEFDLESIIEYIKIDSIEIAKDIFYEIKNQCDQLSIFPASRRIVPELQEIGVLKYRELLFKRWRIIYKIEKEKVYVLIVIDARRDIEDILFQRLLKDNNGQL